MQKINMVHVMNKGRQELAPLGIYVAPLHSLYKGHPIWHKNHPKISLDMGIDKEEVKKI